MAWQRYHVTAAPIGAQDLGAWVYEELRRLTYSLQSLPVTDLVTTAELTDASAPINVLGKFQGRQVFNTTTGFALFANGPAATDTWKDGVNVVRHTPV